MSSGRAMAIKELRRSQRLAREKLGLSAQLPDQKDVLAQALQQADKREQNAHIADGFIGDFAFRYPEMLERKRWARTRDILRRCSPGPDEDPTYLEMLARQAASIEMVLRQEDKAVINTHFSDICDRVLIASVPSLDISAFASSLRNYFLVLIPAGLIDFTYQVTKLTISTWKFKKPKEGMISFFNEKEHIDNYVKANPHVLDSLYKTFFTYLIHGYPRITSYSPPPREYQLPLSFLTAFNERFILAHEYSHTLVDSLGFEMSDELTEMQEEYLADAHAFMLLAESAYILDQVSPNISVQGAFFVLEVFECLYRAIDLIRYGKIRDNLVFSNHPPIENRRQQLIQLYLNKVSAEDDDSSIRGALAPAKSLKVLWELIEAKFKNLNEQSMTLHPIWNHET